MTPHPTPDHHPTPLPTAAVKLINGMTVKVEHGHFRFSVYSAIKVFAIKENYAVDGEEAHFPRRDLRRGAATGALKPQGRRGAAI